VKVASDIEIAGTMTANDVVAVGGNITVSGRVDGNLVAVGGSVTLNADSYVGGDLVVVGGELTKDPKAVVVGKITQVYMPRFIPSITGFLKNRWIALWATISMLVLIGFLGLAVLLVALIPDHMGTAVNTLERSFLASLLWGFAWLVMIVPIAVLLAISIIGVILIPLEVVLVVLAMILGYIASAVFIGKNVLLSFKKAPPPFVDALLGILILFLIGFVPLVGPVIKAAFLVAGFGAIVTTRFGTVK
jgi:putative Mn2+ efflux pump MntP